jgi:hypothetical protein
MCPLHFKLTMVNHRELQTKKHVNKILCNYLRSNGLVNGANGTIEDYINTFPILLLWI